MVNNCKTAILYTYRSGKFSVNEKVVRENFKNYGEVINGGISLYLPERNDELAKRIFIEYMEGRVAKAQLELDKATEYLRKIKDEF